MATLEYRSKGEVEGETRLVKIEGYDLCACCAPHVTTTGEIGIVKILDFHKNKGGTRVFIKCGEDALNDYNERYDNIVHISTLLATKQGEVAAAVDRLSAQVSDLKYEIAGLKRRIIAEKIGHFSQKGEITAVFEDGLDMKEMQLLGDGLFRKYGGIRGVFSKQQDRFCFVLCGEVRAFIMQAANRRLFFRKSDCPSGRWTNRARRGILKAHQRR